MPAASSEILCDAIRRAVSAVNGLGSSTRSTSAGGLIAASSAPSNAAPDNLPAVELLISARRRRAWLNQVIVGTSPPQWGVRHPSRAFNAKRSSTICKINNADGYESSSPSAVP